MTAKLTFLLLSMSLILVLTKSASAFTIDSDPDFVVMDFADVILLDWAAPETKWQAEVKPKIISQINELKQALPLGNAQHKLAWSTLQEYLNHPLDTPNNQSYYAVKINRILDLAEEVNLPVFMPLNGTQWWDELPELYNWWDQDGTHTPEVFFKRQRTTDFRERFIKGFDPDNIWNVDWQDWATPMQLNWRDWGGGGFRLAPPPNLFDHHHKTNLTYHQVLNDRFTVLIQELVKRLDLWEKSGKADLFAGIALGAETSLNASVTPANEFAAYGYRAIQDLLCPDTEPRCGKSAKFTQEQIDNARQDIVRNYATNIAQLATNLGLPKQRIYTHFWGEAKKGDRGWGNYLAGAFNLYSRPGMSFYSFGENPLGLPDWQVALKQSGWPVWGAMEYSPEKTTKVWQNGLQAVFNNPTAPGKIIVMYNWAEHKNTPAIPALVEFLKSSESGGACRLPEILPTSPRKLFAPTEFSWKFLDQKLISHVEKLKLEIVEANRVGFPFKSNSTIDLDPKSEITAAPQLSHGIYSWLVESQGCQGKSQFSEPRIFAQPAMPPPDTTPFWVNWLFKLQKYVPFRFT